MRIARWTVALFALVLLPSLLLASDVAGKWKGQLQQGGNIVLDMKVDKGAITGSMLASDGQEYPISAGKQDGDNVTFTVAVKWHGIPATLHINGKVSGDQMQFHLASESGLYETDGSVKRDK